MSGTKISPSPLKLKKLNNHMCSTWERSDGGPQAGPGRANASEWKAGRVGRRQGEMQAVFDDLLWKARRESH